MEGRIFSEWFAIKRMAVGCLNKLSIYTHINICSQEQQWRLNWVGSHGWAPTTFAQVLVYIRENASSRYRCVRPLCWHVGEQISSVYNCIPTWCVVYLHRCNSYISKYSTKKKKKYAYSKPTTWISTDLLGKLYYF